MIKDNTPVQPAPVVIAIDGPAASGKGTLARRVAGSLGLPHLDTGLTYRAVAKALLDGDGSTDDKLKAIELAHSIDLSNLDRETLSDHHIGEAASRIAVVGEVRTALVEAQRKFANTPPGAVLDGRDIGTVVCPDAPVKLFITATPEKRAQRRFAEMRDKGKKVKFNELLADLKRRDARDSNRKVSPLIPADDALLIDTSKMDIETAFSVAMGHVNKALASENRD